LQCEQFQASPSEATDHSHKPLILDGVVNAGFGFHYFAIACVHEVAAVAASAQCRSPMWTTLRAEWLQVARAAHASECAIRD